MANGNQNSPLVTIITVVYNGVESIEATIKSVIGQTFGPFEYLVIDGKSTDGTVEVIDRYRQKIDYFVSEHDQGIYDAMNKGAAVARGEWIIFMNCGDKFAGPDVLMAFSQSNLSDADVVYGDALIVYNTFEKKSTNLPLEEFWKGMPFSHQACFVRRELFEEQPFDTTYRLSSDYDFLYKAYRKKRRFRYLPHLVCIFDYTSGASIRNARQSIKERKAIVLRYGFSIKVWIYYSFFIQYVAWSGRLKKVLGKSFSEWLIKLVKM